MKFGLPVLIYKQAAGSAEAYKWQDRCCATLDACEWQGVGAADPLGVTTSSCKSFRCRGVTVEKGSARIRLRRRSEEMQVSLFMRINFIVCVISTGSKE